MFIVLEGLDGSGSTTQAKLLVEALNAHGISAIHTSEPTENPIGKLLRSALQKEWAAHPAALQLLFSADRAQHVATEIQPNLTAGKWVVSDRYFWSTIAYGSLSGDEEWLQEVNAPFLRPDFTFFLNVSVQTCLQRIAARGATELFEEELKLKTVQTAFLKLAEQEKNCHILDGEKSMEEVSAEIWNILEKRFSKKLA